MCNQAQVTVYAFHSNVLRADEKGLKGVFNIKGQAGVVPCFSCINVVRRLKLRDTDELVTLACTNPAKFHPRTNEMLYEALRRLSEASTGPKAALERLEKIFGLDYNAESLLFDEHLLKNVLDPIRTHCRRMGWRPTSLA